MSEVSEILEEIEAHIKEGVKPATGVDDVRLYALESFHLIEKLQALLSSHAVIDEETAELAKEALYLQCFDDAEAMVASELTRLSTHKGK